MMRPSENHSKGLDKSKLEFSAPTMSMSQATVPNTLMVKARPLPSASIGEPIIWWCRIKRSNES